MTQHQWLSQRSGGTGRSRWWAAAALVALGLAAAAASTAAPASVTAIGFDDLPGGTVLADQYHGQGVDVDAAAGVTIISPQPFARSKPNALAATGGGGEFTYPYFRATFTNPLHTSVQLWIYDQPASDAQLTAFDAGHNKVAQASVNRTGQDMWRPLAVSTDRAVIASVELGGTPGANGAFVDDPSFDAVGPPPVLLGAPAALDKQLLVNPGAEDGPIASVANPVVAIPGWNTKGTSFTVEAYGPVLGAVAMSESTRIVGGRAFFSGGASNALSRAVQDIDVSSLATDLDRGGVVSILSGWLAGYGHEDDNGSVVLSFLGANRAPVGGVSQRLGPQTGTGDNQWRYYRDQTPVPPGTRILEVTLTATRLAGTYNDAYFDNLSVYLTRNPPHLAGPDSPSPGPMGGELLTNGGAEDGPASRVGGEVADIPGWQKAGSFTVAPYVLPPRPELAGIPGAHGIPAYAEGTRIGGGSKLFVGGPSTAESSAAQTVDLSASAQDIDAGKLDLWFSVWMAGASAGNETAEAYLDELDASGKVLLTLSADQVLGSSSIFEQRLREAPLLPGTRSARVTLHAIPGDGYDYNSAFFDGVSLKLAPAPQLPAPIAAVSGPVPATYGANLLTNPGAEDSDPDPVNNLYNLVAPISGWRTTRNFTAVSYATPGFANVGESDRIGGGMAFFSGGTNSALSTAAQTVDVSAFGPDVDARGVSAHLEAQMAAFEEQGDSGTVIATFMDAFLSPLGTMMLGPVHGHEPLASTYALQQADGLVPPGTRNVQVMLVAQRVSTAGPYDDAYFDNVALWFDRQAASSAGLLGDVDGDGSVGMADAVLVLRAVLGLVALTPDQQARADMLGNGTVSVLDASLILRRALGL